MAEGKSSSPTLEIRKDEEGNHQLGAEIDGAFVPFVTKSASYVQHLADKAAEAAKADK